MLNFLNAEMEHMRGQGSGVRRQGVEKGLGVGGHREEEGLGERERVRGMRRDWGSGVRA
jgi:hypothetical protein